MFGIDGPEFIVILIVLIVVIGPKDLPKILKSVGKATARMRSTANEFRRQFDDAMREAELDDLQKTISDVANLDPRKNLTKVFDPIRDVAKDVRSTLEPTNLTKMMQTDHEPISDIPPVKTVAGTASAEPVNMAAQEVKNDPIKSFPKSAKSSAKPATPKKISTKKKATPASKPKGAKKQDKM